MCLADKKRRRTVTWSIQTMSQLLSVMASPPQTYLGFRSVMATFLQDAKA